MRITAVSGTLYFGENNGISAGQRWQHLTTHIENVIISVTTITKGLLVTRRAKMPLYGVFAFRDIKSHGAAKNALQAIYIKSGNTKTVKMCAVGGQQKTAYLYIQKRHFVKSLSCGYNLVTVIRLRLTAAAAHDILGTMKGAASPRRKWGRLSEAGNPHLDN